MPTVFLDDESFHRTILWLVVPSSLLAFGLGCRRHRDPRVLLLGALGLAGIVPDEVRALDGQQRSIRGFMLPLRFGSDGVSEFLLTASVDSCHFGIVPFITDWVHVEMAEGVPFPGVDPITVFGTFHVDVETDGDDIVGIYRMEGQSVAIHR